MLCAALDAVGLEGYRVGLGDASLFPTLLDELGVAGEPRARILHELYSQDFAGLEREVARLDVDPDAAGLLVRVPQVRGESACSTTSRAGWPTRRWPACAPCSRAWTTRPAGG